MTLQQLEQLQDLMTDEVAKRRRLGGYSQEADAILMLCETVLKLTQHILDGELKPRRRKPN